MGRLIPAGTGLPAYGRLQMMVEEDRRDMVPAAPAISHASSFGAE
jgi:hypothetical protein